MSDKNPDPNQEPVNNPPNSEPFDPSKLSDDDIKKVLSDDRLWKTDRLKELQDKAKKAKALEEEQKKAEEERLKQQGEWEKLAKQNEETANGFKTKYEQSLISNAVYREALKQGIKDVELVEKLIDNGSITITEDGKIEGIAEQITTIVTARPYLKSANPQGGGPNIPGVNPPANPDGKIKLSDMNNPVYYRENEKAIQEALKTGNIDYDN